MSLGLNFDSIAPEVDESLVTDEPAAPATSRLAQAKAAKVFQQHPHAVVIGSDQLCAMESGELVGKPGTIARAKQQLAALSGQRVHFYSALCIVHPDGEDHHTSVTQVCFRDLSAAEIDRYLEREPTAVHCAGSFMSEALGISLVESISSDDPSALIGLPLIASARILRKLGFAVP